jgi:hypothetical protein
LAKLSGGASRGRVILSLKAVPTFFYDTIRQDSDRMTAGTDVRERQHYQKQTSSRLNDDSGPRTSIQ